MPESACPAADSVTFGAKASRSTSASRPPLPGLKPITLLLVESPGTTAPVKSAWNQRGPWHSTTPRRSGEIGGLARGTRQLEDVQARVRAVDDVDVTAVVHLDVVGLDRHLAALVGAGAD